jgi:uncharacterized membrane protein YgcG
MLLLRAGSLLLLLLVVTTAGLNYPNPSSPSCGGGKYVCDPNQYLSQQAYSAIESRLALLEREHPHPCGDKKRGFQVAVALMKNLKSAFPDEPQLTANVEQSAAVVFNKWGVGHAACNNGLLILLAIDDRKSAIKTGSAAQKVVSDSMVTNVLNSDSIKGHLRSADYASAIEHVLDQIEGPLQANKAPEAPSYFALFCFYAAIFFLFVMSCWMFEYLWPSKNTRRDAFRKKLARLQKARDLHNKHDLKTDQTPCAICLESLPENVDFGESAVDKGVQLLSCGHCFHQDCIGQWLKRNDKCPVCRKKNPAVDSKRSVSQQVHDVDSNYFAFAWDNLTTQEEYSSLPSVTRLRTRYAAEPWHESNDYDVLRDYDNDVLTRRTAEKAEEARRAAENSSSDFGGGDCDSGGGGSSDW